MAKNILVVDDSPTIQKLVGFSLKKEGYNVILACDGMDALEKLPREDTDLVITDLNMPNMDGFELIAFLRSNKTYRKIPIIMLTSESEESDRRRGLDVGADSYLVKPFDPSAILAEAKKYLRSEKD